jgi:hypothetical protein
MNDCGWLSDRIPPVALGRAQWTTQELQHLQECPACRKEWQLVLAASRLGEVTQGRIDTEAAAASLLERLRDDRTIHRARTRTWTLGGLAAAAAIAMAVWIGNAGDAANTGGQNGALAAAPLEIPLPELESLQPAELDSVLRTMDEPSNFREASAEDLELSDLTSDELQRVLDTWEG